MPRCELSRLKKESVSAGELLMKNLEKLDQISIPLNSQVNQLGSIPFLTGSILMRFRILDPSFKIGFIFMLNRILDPSCKIVSILNRILDPSCKKGSILMLNHISFRPTKSDPFWMRFWVLDHPWETILLCYFLAETKLIVER